MINKTKVMEQHSKIRIPDWMFQEIQEDDFLLGKTPMALGDDDTWEEEE